MKTKKDLPMIADYDSVQYDYSTYWEGREYEDAADKMALERLLHTVRHHVGKHEYYIDIGGSYGRELETYRKYFKKIILFDYSLNTLIAARKNLESQGIKNVMYVAGNVYHMPFKSNTLDEGQMVRVMHHLRFPEKAFAEFDRVIRKFLIVEYANKLHFKARLRFLSKGNLGEIRNSEPYQQEFRSTSQGSSGENQIFLNFHPKHIKEVVGNTHFKIKKKLSASNFRSPFLKRVFHIQPLIGIERKVQTPLATFNFGPSMYLLLEKADMSKRKKELNVEELFACPKCLSEMKEHKNSFVCSSCNSEFSITEGVYDFRYTDA